MLAGTTANRQVDATSGLRLFAMASKMADPDFYRTAGAQVAATTKQLETIEAELVEAYARWEELETLSG